MYETKLEQIKTNPVHVNTYNVIRNWIEKKKIESGIARQSQKILADKNTVSYTNRWCILNHIGKIQSIKEFEVSWIQKQNLNLNRPFQMKW